MGISQSVRADCIAMNFTDLCNDVYLEIKRKFQADRSTVLEAYTQA
jgi:hypothetical protein